IASWINFSKSRIDVDQAIYFGGTKAMVDKIAAMPDSVNDVFIVAHEPYLSETITKLTGDELEKFPTCAAYRIFWDVDTWEQALAGMGSKHTFITPKLLLNKE